MVAMNLVLTAINLWFIAKLWRDRRSDTAYAVLQVAGDDTYLQHFLKVEGAEIARTAPNFDGLTDSGERTAYLVLKGHETVGAVAVRDVGDGVARIELDYVTPRFRDFTPGEFVWLSAVRGSSAGTGSAHRHAARDGRRLLRPARLHPQR